MLKFFQSWWQRMRAFFAEPEKDQAAWEAAEQATAARMQAGEEIARSTCWSCIDRIVGLPIEEAYRLLQKDPCTHQGVSPPAGRPS